MLLVVVGALGYWGWQHLATPGTTATTVGGSLVIDVPEGASAEDVAHSLQEAGVISSATTFLVRLKLAGGDAAIQPGRYTFQGGEGFDSIIARLKQGGIIAVQRVVLPEGLAIGQAAKRVAASSTIDAESYESLAREPGQFSVPTIDGRPGRPADLEGFLFPSTYELRESDGARVLIERQLEAFSRKTADLPWANAAKHGVTPYQALIVASLIEKEARVPEERAKVAAVIYNRLERKMSLGIDATVRFALGKWTGSLTKSDLAVDSPYNTRRRKGLPPGPIASPGLAALRAALSPAKTDALYYVLVDRQGHHLFTASYQEFLRAQAKIPAASR